jgi:hypothetical protein
MQLVQYAEEVVDSPFANGLTEAVLIDAVLRGEARRNEATPLDVPSRGGSECHFEKVRALREPLCPQGWKVNNELNYCRVESPCGRHSIAVAKGSKATGNPQMQPETVRAMGDATRMVVQCNKLQLALPFPGAKLVLPRPNVLTWVLLTYRGDKFVRAELSLPSHMSDEGFVCRWEARYILDEINLGGPTPQRKKNDEPADSFEINVSLR